MTHLMPSKELMTILLSMNIYMIKECTFGININLPRWKAPWIKKKGAKRTFHSLIDVEQRAAQRSRAMLIYKAFIVCTKPLCIVQLFFFYCWKLKSANLLHMFGYKRSAGAA